MNKNANFWGFGNLLLSILVFKVSHSRTRENSRSRGQITTFMMRNRLDSWWSLRRSPIPMIPEISTRATVTWEETRGASPPFSLKVNERTRCTRGTRAWCVPTVGCLVLRRRNENERSREGRRAKREEKKKKKEETDRREGEEKGRGIEREEEGTPNCGKRGREKGRERDGDAPGVTRQSWLRRVPWCVARLNINPKAKKGRRKKRRRRRKRRKRWRRSGMNGASLLSRARALTYRERGDAWGGWNVTCAPH